jgi:hypothetical protein
MGVLSTYYCAFSLTFGMSIAAVNLHTIQSDDPDSYERKVVFALVKGLTYGLIFPISSIAVMYTYMTNGDMRIHTSLGEYK